MTTKVDVARMLFSDSAPRGGYAGSQYESQVQIRWGTITEVLGTDGWYKVQLDGMGIEVDAYSDSPHNVGERVQVIWQENRFVIIGNAGLMKKVESDFDRTFTQIEDTHQELADQITQEVNDAFSKADSALEEFKSTHKLTDDDITKSIEDTKRSITVTFEGKLEDASKGYDEKYATKTEMSVGIEGVRSSVTESYKRDLDNLSDSLSSQITQTAKGIQTTVEQSVTDKLGSYYSKTEWQQGSTGYTATVHQAVTDTNENTSFLETNFSLDSYGLTVGSSAHTYKSRVGTQGFSILQNSTELASFKANGTYTQLTSSSSKALQLHSDGETNLFGGFLTTNQTDQYSSFTSTAKDNTGYILGASRLFYSYGGFSSGQFSLSRSVSNYSFLEIIYEATNYHNVTLRGSTRASIYGTQIQIPLFLINYDKTDVSPGNSTSVGFITIFNAMLSLVNDKGILASQGHLDINQNGGTSLRTSNLIRIISVTGYR